MNIRLRCGCGARLTTSTDLRGHVVRCAKCGKMLRVPESKTLAPVTFVSESEPEPTEASAAEPIACSPAAPPAPPVAAEPGGAADTWQSHGSVATRLRTSGGRGGRWMVLVLVLLLPIGVVAVLFALPFFEPKDPREQVAQKYLDALRREDWPEANRLSVLSMHPRLVGVESVALSEHESPAIRGSFRPLRQFHDGIAQKYTFNPDRGRFDPKDPVGLGLDVLSNLEGIKKQAQDRAAQESPPGRSRGNPDEKLLDEVIGTYGIFGEIAKQAGGLLSSGTLGPTYQDLLEKTPVPLRDAERRLAALFARDPAKWQRLLGRSFLELPDLGEFEFQDVEVTAMIRTEGQSLGEPGRPIKIRLVRFTMGSIDTGWRVWQAE